jgi:hypothetical protein
MSLACQVPVTTTPCPNGHSSHPHPSATLIYTTDDLAVPAMSKPTAPDTAMTKNGEFFFPFFLFLFYGHPTTTTTALVLHRSTRDLTHRICANRTRYGTKDNKSVCFFFCSVFFPFCPGALDQRRQRPTTLPTTLSHTN